MTGWHTFTVHLSLDDAQIETLARYLTLREGGKTKQRWLDETVEHVVDAAIDEMLDALREHDSQAFIDEPEFEFEGPQNDESPSAGYAQHLDHIRARAKQDTVYETALREGKIDGRHRFFR